MSDISKHPLIKQSYEVGLAIEACGASEALTNASVKASALTEALDDYLSNHKNDWNTETLAILDRAIARADKALPEAQPTSPEREWLNLGERLDAMTKPEHSEKHEAQSWMIANDYVTFNPETSQFGNGKSFPEALAAYRRHVLADAIEKV